jgi:hypothetical protein
LICHVCIRKRISHTEFLCAYVKYIQNEGGVTNFRGGFRPAIIPAGYVGVAFWGGVFVALSGSRLGATIAAGIFMTALLICLRCVVFGLVGICGYTVTCTSFSLSLCCRYSPNGMLIGLCIGFFCITLAVTLIDWLVFTPLLEFVTLFYGVFIGWYGIMDIWDDTISRTVEGSDASACFQMWRCCLPRCVGLQFLLCAVCCQCLGLYFALVSLMNEKN